MAYLLYRYLSNIISVLNQTVVNNAFKLQIFEDFYTEKNIKIVIINRGY